MDEQAGTDSDGTPQPVRSVEHVAIRDKFVAPFYGEAGLYGFLSWDPKEREVWLGKFAKTSGELDEAIAHVLFDTQNWRGRRVAALMVGYRDWKQFSSLMIDRIQVSSASHERFAMFVGIAMLADASAAEALCEYLDKGTDMKGWLAAAATLAELDRVHGSFHSEPYLAAEGPLERWQAEHRDLYPPEMTPPQLPAVGEIVDIFLKSREQS